MTTNHKLTRAQAKLLREMQAGERVYYMGRGLTRTFRRRSDKKAVRHDTIGALISAGLIQRISGHALDEVWVAL